MTRLSYCHGRVAHTIPNMVGRMGDGEVSLETCLWRGNEQKGRLLPHLVLLCSLVWRLARHEERARHCCLQSLTVIYFIEVGVAGSDNATAGAGVD